MPKNCPNEEIDLLLKISEGNETAFTHLLNIHYNKLASFVFQLTKSRTITQELVNDVFVKVWLNRHKLRGIENFEAWIFIIARNHVFSHLKKIAREYKQKEAWQEYMVAETENTDNTMYAHIENWIEKLPPQQKKVYELKLHEGLKNEEVAKQMKISQDTVKKHFTLALRFIRDHVGLPVEILIIMLHCM